MKNILMARLMQISSNKHFLFHFTTLIFLTIFSANALAPEVRFSDEIQEERARKLFLEVRCLVCNGQVIESSNTEFSFEMRKLIRKKISEKKSDEKIKKELVEEFGDDILTTPNAKTFKGFLLWFLPVVFAIVIAVILIKINRTKEKTVWV